HLPGRHHLRVPAFQEGRVRQGRPRASGRGGIVMTERETDAHSGTETTGHEWDGIKELDTPLPRWWLILFYACIAIAVVYWVLMPAWPGIHSYTPGILHRSNRVDVARDLAAMQAQRSAQGAGLTNASLEQIEKDPGMQ